MNPTKAQVYELAEQIYEQECRNELMPPWDEAPHVYTRGCINDAAVRLGWKPPGLSQEEIVAKVRRIYPAGG